MFSVHLILEKAHYPTTSRLVTTQSETIKQLYDQIDFRVFRFGARMDSQLASREESKMSKCHRK